MINWREKDAAHQAKLADKLMRFFKGNTDAVNLCVNLTFVCHLWDDLYDGDRQRTPQEISDAFRVALFDIPTNPFYIAYGLHLKPLILNAILCWQDANILEVSSNPHDQHLAYGLRAAFLQIFNYCAYLIGGSEWAREVGPDIRRIYEEPLQDFTQEMEQCRTQSQE